MRSNVIEHEAVDHYHTLESIHSRANSHAEDEDELLANHPYAIELRKLLDVLEMLRTQAMQVLEQELDVERTLKQLAAHGKPRNSTQSVVDHFITVN